MTAVDPWTIVNTQTDGAHLAQFGSVFTIANGYVGLRGRLAEERQGPYPVTLLAGVYDELDMFGLLRCAGRPRCYLDATRFDDAGPSPAVANLPDPLFVRLYVGGNEVVFDPARVTGFRQTLDLRTGLYAYTYEYRTTTGTLRIEMERFASLTDVHRVYMRYHVTTLSGPLAVTLDSGMDASVRSNLTGERRFRVGRADAAAGRVALDVVLPARGIEVQLRVQSDQHGTPWRQTPIVEHDRAYVRYEGTLAPGAGCTLERCIVLASGRDGFYGAPVQVEAELAAAVAEGFDAALARQRAAWAALWEHADVQIEGDPNADQYLRLCLYHLLAAAPRHSERLAVPVKLLTGEYYQGNVFYDTDLYIVPFYTFTHPELARTHLNWRYHSLPAARALARQLGGAGAKFAWQAGPDGEECLGPWWRFPRTNIHIDADVSFCLRQYYAATADGEFWKTRGLEILSETARFYAARARAFADDDSYDFHDVTGPDEGHCGVMTEFYTNYLAAWNLKMAAAELDRLRHADPGRAAELGQRLRLLPDEPAAWRRIGDRLRLRCNPATKVYEQFAGFHTLNPLPPVLAGDRRGWFADVAEYQALNQPDVLLAMMLFRSDFAPDELRANWEFYKDKSMNFSSMSYVVQAVLAAEFGDVPEAYRNFLITAGMDLDETFTGRRDTQQGLHGSAMGGAWLAAVFGFAGVCLWENGLRVQPRLPATWERLAFRLRLRGASVACSMEPGHLRVTVGDESALDLPACLAGDSVVLRRGQAYDVRRGGARA
ncbi:MAG TPA: glycosyl hydrolase family 65 protein [Phycisphaerae bacterium]|nr:glycosyl hydrolase family 65 protein [Phycisphaerae bacterium]HNU46601.1 glycosyl hydrolase family 65 protein [Phycisphaerae bacterium]